MSFVVREPLDLGLDSIHFLLRVFVTLVTLLLTYDTSLAVTARRPPTCRRRPELAANQVCFWRLRLYKESSHTSLVLEIESMAKFLSHALQSIYRLETGLYSALNTIARSYQFLY